MMMIAKDWASSQQPRRAWLQTAHPLAGLAAMGERTASRRVAYWRISEKLKSAASDGLWLTPYWISPK